MSSSAAAAVRGLAAAGALAGFRAASGIRTLTLRRFLVFQREPPRSRTPSAVAAPGALTLLLEQKLGTDPLLAWQVWGFLQDWSRGSKPWGSFWEQLGIFFLSSVKCLVRTHFECLDSGRLGGKTLVISGAGTGGESAEKGTLQ